MLIIKAKFARSGRANVSPLPKSYLQSLRVYSFFIQSQIRMPRSLGPLCANCKLALKHLKLSYFFMPSVNRPLNANDEAVCIATYVLKKEIRNNVCEKVFLKFYELPKW